MFNSYVKLPQGKYHAIMMFNQFREVIEVIHHLLIRILPVQNSGIPRFFPAYPILNHSHVDTTD